MKKTLLFVFLLLLSVISSQAQVSASWKLIENKFTDKPYHRAELAVKNISGKKIDAGWKLYFNTVFISVPTEVKNPGIVIRHLQGDFFVLEGTDKTPALTAGEEIKIEYRSSEPYQKNSYAPEALIFLKSDGNYFEEEE